MSEGLNNILVEVQDLHKHYGETRALQGVSFTVKRGEILGFLGPNGAGKTTTMQILTGFLKPTAGRVCINGLEVGENSLKTRQMLGYLPENAPLYEEMMVIDFLHFVADLRELPKSVKAERLKTVATQCGLLNVLGKDIGQLSKGYKQRVGIAQAFIHDPDLLILDEPTSGLDPNQIVEIRALIKTLGAKKTVILCTHILSEVQATCNRIIIINEGKLVADNTQEALLAKAGKSVIRLVVKANTLHAAAIQEVQSALAHIHGVHQVALDDQIAEAGNIGLRLDIQGNSDPRSEIFNSLVHNNWTIIDMHKDTSSLEEVFHNLTRGN